MIKEKLYNKDLKKRVETFKEQEKKGGVGEEGKRGTFTKYRTHHKFNIT